MSRLPQLELDDIPEEYHHLFTDDGICVHVEHLFGRSIDYGDVPFGIDLDDRVRHPIGDRLQPSFTLFQRGNLLVSGLGRVRHATSDALGSNIKKMLALGAYLNIDRDGRYYARVRNLRAALVEAFDETLSDVDLLAAPGTPTTALEIDGFERGVTPPVNWVTHPTNLTGHPSVTLPCGEVDGLPVGLQFMGPTGCDQAVLDAAHAYEEL